MQEKKQKQLAELRVIEEEIKQGKLAKTTPVAAEEIYSSLQRQPIPRAKTHAEPPTWPSIELAHSYQNYPVLPHSCNLYPTYTEIKPEYNPPFSQETTEKPTFRTTIYNQDRTFYENPANLRNDGVTNYLPINERKFEPNICRSPRNVLNNSPRNYLPDVSTNNYETSQNRITNQNSMYEERQNIPEFSYEDNQYNKEEYISSLNPLNGVDNMRNIYSEGCNQYNQCDRFYPGLGKKDRKQRCRTPEILLAPHYLEGCNRQVCCNWGAPYP